MNWTNITAAEPTKLLFTEENFQLLRDHLNAEDDEQSLVLFYAAAAQGAIEGPTGIGVPLLNTLWNATAPADFDVSDIPLQPVQSVESVVIDGATAAIQFVAGYGETFEDIPADLRAAIMLMTGNLYANRQSVSAVENFVIPDTLQSIINRYRVVNFG